MHDHELNSFVYNVSRSSVSYDTQQREWKRPIVHFTQLCLFLVQRLHCMLPIQLVFWVWINKYQVVIPMKEITEMSKGSTGIFSTTCIDIQCKSGLKVSGLMHHNALHCTQHTYTQHTHYCFQVQFSLTNRDAVYAQLTKFLQVAQSANCEPMTMSSYAIINQMHCFGNFIINIWAV